MSGFNWFRRSYDEASQPAEQDSSETATSTDQSAEAEATSSDTQPANAEDYLKWAKLAYQNIQKRQQPKADTPESPEESTFESEDTSGQPAAASTDDEQASTAATPPPAETPVEAPTTTADAAATEILPAVQSADEAESAIAAPLESEATAAPPADASAVESALEKSELSISTTDEQHTDEVVNHSARSVESAAVESEHSPSTSEPGRDDAVSQEDTSSEATADSPLPFWARAEAERLERLERLKETAIAEPEPQPQPVSRTPTPAPANLEPDLPDEILDEAFLWSAEVLASQGRRPDQISLEEITWLNKLRQGLDKTRRSLVNQLKAIVGQGPLNEDAVLEIESLMLQADVGVEATDRIISSLQAKLRDDALPPDQAIAYLKSILREMLDSPLQGEHNLTFVPEKGQLSIWLMTGVNGAGKTTTIGKLAHIAQKSGYACLIAAADTFRAAAVEQVKVWGQRSGVEVIANPGQNTDPAAVVFDAISAAQSRGTELLLVDTAGRLQNKKNLMDELAKVRRIIDKKAPGVQVESLLVLDATLGQNGLRQAEVFAEAAQLSGVVLTKLDGTAKGGVALAVVQQLGLPIRFIGAGEGIEDLRPFSSYEFVEALLNG